jgi:hypothetical protein
MNTGIDLVLSTKYTNSIELGITTLVSSSVNQISN